MCLGIKGNKGSFMKTCELYFDPLEEKKMFCTKCETAVDGVVLFCSFCGVLLFDVRYTAIVMNSLQAQMMKRK